MISASYETYLIRFFSKLNTKTERKNEKEKTSASSANRNWSGTRSHTWGTVCIIFIEICIFNIFILHFRFYLVVMHFPRIDNVHNLAIRIAVKHNKLIIWLGTRFLAEPSNLLGYWRKSFLFPKCHQDVPNTPNIWAPLQSDLLGSAQFDEASNAGHNCRGTQGTPGDVSRRTNPESYISHIFDLFENSADQESTTMKIFLISATTCETQPVGYCRNEITVNHSFLIRLTN